MKLVTNNNKAKSAFSRKPHQFACDRNVRQSVKVEHRFCAFCGAVILIAGDRLRASKNGSNVFCDIQCTGEHKRWYNLTAEYRKKSFESRITASQLDSMLRDEKKVYVSACLCKGWKCCANCDRAFFSTHGRKLTCSNECSHEYLQLRAKIKSKMSYWENGSVIGAKCACCGKAFKYQTVKRQKKKLYCSARCNRKSEKQRRRHRIRATYSSEVFLNDVARTQKWKCYCCGVKCTLPNGSNASNEATLDHIHPLSKGGLHIRSNVQMLCRECNTRKSSDLVCGTQLNLPLYGGYENVERCSA